MVYSHNDFRRLQLLPARRNLRQEVRWMPSTWGHLPFPHDVWPLRARLLLRVPIRRQ